MVVRELLWAAACLGDQVTDDDAGQQFEDLYRRTSASLLAYLLRRTASPQDAADLLAEVYLIAWRRRHSLPRAEEQRLWLFGVARNVLASHRRRLTRDRGTVVALADELSRRLPSRDPDADSSALRAPHCERCVRTTGN